ncbi:hypothetical protein GGH19_001569 [Coemansia sp. RSA 1807]|nr:hypothetical protein GGH19_001569 [Coemansia sp. RSA 1807]
MNNNTGAAGAAALNFGHAQPLQTYVSMLGAPTWPQPNPLVVQQPMTTPNYMPMMQQLHTQQSTQQTAPHTAVPRSTPSGGSTPAMASAPLPGPTLAHDTASAADSNSSPALSTATRKSQMSPPKATRKRRMVKKPPINAMLRTPVMQVPTVVPQEAAMPREVVGTGMEQLLAFHDAFAPHNEPRGLDYCDAVIKRYFTREGIIKFGMGGQTYEVPMATAGRFYHCMFGNGVTGMRMVLGEASVWRVSQSKSTITFHNACMTTTYAIGRRVEETGVLRVFFGLGFRMRVWAFDATDSTVLLPRKRPAGSDIVVRISDVSIARNLDWPNDMPPPRRRKSAHARQAADDCLLPVPALNHLEVSNTLALMKDLFSFQKSNPQSSVSGVLDEWASVAKPAPLEVSKPAPERKRVRRKSAAQSVAAPVVPLSTLSAALSSSASAASVPIPADPAPPVLSAAPSKVSATTQ